MKRMVGSVLVAAVAFATAVATGQRSSGTPERRAEASMSVSSPAPSSNPENATRLTDAPVGSVLPSPYEITTAGSTSYDPCAPVATVLPGQGPALAEPITIPAVPVGLLPGAAAAFDPGPGDVPESFPGTILRPADTQKYPGPRPAVVLMHGIYGEQCQMWWLARYLAGAGYVSVVLTSPTPAVRSASYGVAIDAARSAVRFLATPVENPYFSATMASDVALAGWSEGSVVASVVQGQPDMGVVKTIVAFDDLRGSFLGDSGAPFVYCTPPVKGAVVPRVPALGFASDKACDVAPLDTSRQLKLSGFDRWRAAGIPAVELPLAGYGHFDYDKDTPKLVPVAALTLGWHDAWLEGHMGDLASAFASCEMAGRPTAGTLSSTYDSAAYLPGLGIDSTNWAFELARRCGQDPKVAGTTPLS